MLIWGGASLGICLIRLMTSVHTFAGFCAGPGAVAAAIATSTMLTAALIKLLLVSPEYHQSPIEQGVCCSW